MRKKPKEASIQPTGFPFGLPFPKTVLQSIGDIPLEIGRAQPPAELVGFLKKKLGDTGADIANDISGVFAPLWKRFEAEFRGRSVEDALKYAGEIESAVLRGNPTFSATVPIAFQKSETGKPEVIGSAVLVRIVNRAFLLTAAHVTDHEAEGTLLIPGQRGFMQPTGHFAAMRLPASGSRADDKLDVAYFWLDDICAASLHSDCTVLERPDISLEAEPRRRTIYTLAGYPWRKTRSAAAKIETNFWTFSGFEAKRSEYDALGLSRSRNIAIRFHRRRTFHDRKRRVVTAPLPHGMSGGGIYIWDEEAMKSWPVRLPLVGIANEYVAERSLLIGTRLHVYVRCIFHNQPDLAAIAAG